MDIKAANSGIATIRQGLKGLDRDAAKVAHAAASEGRESPAEPLVESRQHRLQVEAGAKVVKTADEMLGALIDELA